MNIKVKKPSAIYFTKIIALRGDYVMLVSHLVSEGSQPTVSRILMLIGGKWSFLFDIDEVVYATAQKPANISPPKGSVCFLGRRGKYVEMVRTVRRDEVRIDTRKAGYLMDMRLIGDRLFAVGGQNIVVTQKGSNWSRIDKGIFSPIGATVDRGLNAVAGFNQDDIYAVGLGGAIWHYEGTNWNAIDSPTNVTLKSVACVGDKIIIGAGAGIVLIGDRKGGWQILQDDAVTRGSIEAIVPFQGSLMLGTDSDLISLKGNKLEKVAVKTELPLSFLSLDVAEDVLWTAGDELVGRYDGKKWTVYACPENE
jgi:hypothetical protein